MAQNKLRVGIIGANVNYGWGHHAHLPALTTLPDIELAAVCTAHKSTARASAEKFRIPLAFHDHREMLLKADIDVVAVVVRVPLHHRLTLDVLSAHKPVFTEWPLGASLREAEEMAELANLKGLLGMVGLQGRCSRAAIRLKELVDEGYIGEILSVNLVQFGSGVLARTSDRTWQRDKALGANTLSIAFGHSIDMLCMCLGEFRDVSATVNTRVRQWHETDTDRMVNVTSPDNVIISGTLKSGVVVSAHVSNVPWHGSGFRMEVYGREGTMVLISAGHPQIGGVKLLAGRNSDSALEELAVPQHPTSVPQTVPQGAPFNVAQMWQRFAEGLRNDRKVDPDFDLAVTRHRLLDAIQRSSDEGMRQKLP